MRSIMFVSITAFTSFLPFAFATVVCAECFSIDRVQSPGVGFDLTMGYGLAAIEFQNGTKLDIIKINGSAEFRNAMVALAEDSKRMKAGKPSQFENLGYEPPGDIIDFIPTFYNLTPPRILQRLILKAQKIMPILKSTPNWTNDLHVLAIGKMISQLKQAANEIHSLTQKNIFLSVPDYYNRDHFDVFAIASAQANLEGFGSQRSRLVTTASKSALAYYNIDIYGHDYNNNPAFTPNLVEDLSSDASSRKRINTVLAITYTEASLGTTFLKRDDLDLLLPIRISEDVTYSADAFLKSTNEKEYWSRVKETIQSAVADDPVDYLLMLGSRTEDDGLWAVIKEVCDENGCSKVLDWQQIHDSESTERNDLYASARAAAATARWGMRTDFEVCTDQYGCPPRDYKIEEKSEL